MFNPGQFSGMRPSRGGGLGGLVRKVVVLVFAGIQAILVGRILLDLGVLPVEGTLADIIVPWSDTLAAPVAGIGDGLGGLMGGFGMPGMGGPGVPGLGGSGSMGLNPAMIAALVGWTVVEGLVLRVVTKVATA